jgi:hypothetical protein
MEMQITSEGKMALFLTLLKFETLGHVIFFHFPNFYGTLPLAIILNAHSLL